MILLQVALILCNAFFACAEIAVISFNDAKLAKRASEGDKRAIRLARLTSQPARFLATIQVAITLSGFLGSAFAAENFSDLIVDWLVGLGVGVSVSTLNTISVVVITIILSYFSLVFGELVPKRIAMRKAEKMALAMSAIISGISKIFRPIVWLLTASTNGILRLIGIDPNAEDNEVSEEEIRMMVDMGWAKGAIDHEEQQFIQNVFEFDDLTAGEIATHRTEVALLWMEETMEEWKNTIYSSHYTYYPVCGETADDVIGVLHTKDFFRLEDQSRESVMAHAVKPAYFVPESVKADVLFRNMKHTHNKLAVVLDEYGGMSGIVTMNDLIEQLVGDLGDEGQNDEPEMEQIDENTWKIHGSVAIRDLSETLGVQLSNEEYDTFNGLVFSELGSVPEDGTFVSLEVTLKGGRSLSIQVTDIQDHQVEAATVRLNQPAEPAEPEEQ